MMLTKLISVASLAILAVAIPTDGNTGNQCSSGSVSCCNQVGSAGSLVPGLLNLLNIADGVNVGLDCNPVCSNILVILLVFSYSTFLRSSVF